MASSNVEFYEKIKRLQDIQYESEEKRIYLEQQLNSYAKSDQRLGKLKAVRLQNYWKKICEDERRSQWRNEQLLKDLDRVDSQIESLSTRTERLRTMKRQYEDYIEKTYPNWKEKILSQHHRKLQSKQSGVVTAGSGLSPGLATLLSQPAGQPGISLPNIQLQQHGQYPPTISVQSPNSTVPNQQLLGHLGYQPAAAYQPTAAHQPATGYQPPTAYQPQAAHQPTTGYQPPIAYQPQAAHQPATGYQPPTAYQPQAAHQPATGYQPPTAYQPVTGSYQPVTTGYQATAAYQLTTTYPPVTATGVQPMTTYPTGSSQGYNPPTIPPIDLQALNTNPTNPEPAKNPYLLDTTINTTLQTVSSLPTGVSMTDTQDELLHAYSSASQEPTLRATDDEEAVTSPKVTVRNQAQDTFVVDQNGDVREDENTWRTDTGSPAKQEDGEDSEIGSDMSLPLSGSPRQVSRPVITPRSTRSQGSVKSQESNHSVAAVEPQFLKSQLSQESRDDKSVYPEADITLEGLYNLLECLQHSLPSSRNSAEFYRTQNPAPSVTKDIIHNANKGATLSHVDPVSISMVIMDQLPLVVSNCENNSLIPDEFLFSLPTTITREVVRSKIHGTSQDFWDHMFEHFTELVKFKVMTPTEVAEYFAPLIIDDDSPYDESAKRVLRALLDDVPVDPLSPTSTTTLDDSLLQPHSRQPAQPLHKERDAIMVPSAAAAAESSDDEDEFFDKPAPLETMTLSTGTLTQTDAYRKMLGDTMSSQQSAPVVETDSDEDVEKLLNLTPGHPRTSTMPDPMSSTLMTTGGTTGVNHADPADDEPSEKSSLHSPAPYVPSALTNTGKSTISLNSSKSAKKPGDSDTDEDIDLPSAGKNDDDFDFYG